MSDDLSLDSQLLLNDMRLRVLNRQPVAPDEYRKLLSSLRGDRENAARASAAAKRTAKRVIGATATPTVSVSDMFPQFRKTALTKLDQLTDKDGNIPDCPDALG